MEALPPILDPACGSRKFYFQKDSPLVLFGDIRDESYVQSNYKKLEIHPDQQMDFRDLPFEDESFALVVFDPPHLFNLGKNSLMGQAYGVLDRKTWREDIKKGFDECWRVLKPEGTLIFKWSGKDVKMPEMLFVLGRTPLLGNKRPGKESYWMVFFKPKQKEPESS